jgi:2-(1,2-epoxy-1,2-dihydrophenyl)acetyl-CoA isomerase
MSQENTVLYEVDGAIATVTINRPHRRNAMLSSMLQVMNDTLRRAADDRNIRVLIIRGAANDFCPGADLDVTASGDTSVRQALTPEDFLVPVLLHEMPAVTIAAIKGGCAGAGLGWALGCDLRFAAPSARPKRASSTSCRENSMPKRRFASALSRACSPTRLSTMTCVQLPSVLRMPRQLRFGR